jgi:hypothetical protein
MGIEPIAVAASELKKDLRLMSISSMVRVR